MEVTILICESRICVNNKNFNKIQEEGTSFLNRVQRNAKIDKITFKDIENELNISVQNNWQENMGRQSAMNLLFGKNWKCLT